MERRNSKKQGLVSELISVVNEECQTLQSGFASLLDEGQQDCKEMFQSGFDRLVDKGIEKCREQDWTEILVSLLDEGRQECKDRFKSGGDHLVGKSIEKCREGDLESGLSSRNEERREYEERIQRGLNSLLDEGRSENNEQRLQNELLREQRQESRDQNWHHELAYFLEEQNRDSREQNWQSEHTLLEEQNRASREQKWQSVLTLLEEQNRDSREQNWQSELTLLEEQNRDSREQNWQSELTLLEEQNRDSREQNWQSELNYFLEKQNRDSREQNWQQSKLTLLEEQNRDSREQKWQSELTLLEEQNRDSREQNWQSELTLLEEQNRDSREQKWQSELTLLEEQNRDSREQNWQSELTHFLEEKNRDSREQNWQSELNHFLEKQNRDSREQNWQSELTPRQKGGREECSGQTLLSEFTHLLSERRDKKWLRGFTPQIKRFLCQYESSRLCDLTLTFSNTNVSFKVHRRILALNSPVLEDKLFTPDSEVRELELSDEPDESFLWVLVYMYKGSSTQLPSTKICLRVCQLASKYQIDALYPVCSNFLMEVLQMENLLEIYSAAVLMNSRALLHRCQEMMNVHANEVLSSKQVGELSLKALKHLLENLGVVSSEALVLVTVITWSKAQLAKRNHELTKTILRQEIEDILPQGCIFKLSVETIINLVFPSDIPASEKNTEISKVAEHHSTPLLQPNTCSTPTPTGDLRCFQLPVIEPLGKSVRVVGREVKTLVSNLKTNKKVLIKSVECPHWCISTIKATVVDAEGKVLQVAETAADKAFVNPVTLDPSMSCTLTTGVRDRWFNAMQPFQVTLNGVTFDGEQAYVYKRCPKIYFWCRD